MIRLKSIFIPVLIILFELASFAQDSLSFKGQLSSWMLYNHDTNLPLYLGGRYIPQLNYDIRIKSDHQINFEASANFNGSFGFNPFDTISTYSQAKLYRLFARYSSSQFELRAGLQKINFGSASILRPLMWFDRVDMRDPLKLTDGVWGILGRYYFLNNANLWLWGLYGNDKPSAWEYVGTYKKSPEIGGRIQLPVPSGEAALSYNYRLADSRELNGIIPAFSKIPENKFGFDMKLDLFVGYWLEGSWVNKGRDIGQLTNQEIFNSGIDYTFGIGNGIYVIFEQLLAASDIKPFNFQNSSSFSLLSVSYPIGLFDNLSGIVYYDWKNRNSYNFINWQKQFNKISFYVMGYWNPVNYNIPAVGSGPKLFAGKGIQIMFVWNH